MSFIRIKTLPANLSRMGYIALSITGLAGIFALALPIIIINAVSLAGLLSAKYAIIVTAVLLFYLIPLSIIAHAGLRGLKKADLMERFQRIINGRTMVPLSDLARAGRRNLRQVQKDIECFLASGLFPEGRLTADREFLVLSDRAWEEYCEACDREARRKAEEAERRKKEDMLKGTPPVLSERDRQFISSCSDLSSRLSTAAETMQGGTLKEKTVQTAALAKRIIARAEAEPASIARLERFESYYLPTAIRLALACISIEEAGMGQDETALRKTEIEAAMTMLEEAFAKLIGSLYENTAWELQADIAVLNSVLARDGLTKGGI